MPDNGTLSDDNRSGACGSSSAVTGSLASPLNARPAGRCTLFPTKMRERQTIALRGELVALCFVGGGHSERADEFPAGQQGGRIPQRRCAPDRARKLWYHG